MRQSIILPIALALCGVLKPAGAAIAQGWAPGSGPATRSEIEREIKSAIAQYRSSGVTEAAIRRIVDGAVRKQARITSAELHAEVQAEAEQLKSLNERVTLLEQRPGGIPRQDSRKQSAHSRQATSRHWPSS